MDALTHTLFGTALSQAGLNRLAPRATLTLLISANFPDIDVVSFAGGSIQYLKYHRGITHSILGVFLGALVLASLISIINRRFPTGKDPGKWWKLYLLASIGLGSHVLLDFTNSYGERLFAPFQNDWYAWDIVFIMDPWILAGMILALGLPFLSRLINQEIGAAIPKRNWGAITLLVLIVFYWMAKDLSRRHALDQLQAEAYESGEILRMGAFPSMANPFEWNGVVETDTAYHLSFAGTLGEHSPLLRKKNRTIIKEKPGPVIQAAQGGPQGRIYFDFARFPAAQLTETPEGFQVTFRDLRYEGIRPGRTSFEFTCQLDQNFRLQTESFHLWASRTRLRQ
jgi:inner membrane protein